MKKFLVLILALFGAITLVACKDDPIVETAKEVRINFAVSQDQRRISYTHGTPITMPSGKVIKSGDLKPVWQDLGTELKTTIVDKSLPGTKPTDMFDIQAGTQFSSSAIYGGQNLSEKIMSSGVDGYFLPLNENFDKLPDFKKYLDKNPLVAQSLVASDGNIYQIPYISEVGNYAKMFHARQSWVTLLLDGKVYDYDADGNKTSSDFVLETETLTLNPSYEAYWKSGSQAIPYGTRHSIKNVIDRQNDAAIANGGKLTQATALSVLTDYIKEVYPQFTTLSDLYIGAKADYDIDELVALFRVMKLSPKSLSLEATGVVKADAEIIPYFERQASHRENLFRLMNYFGGQRVHGSDSYGSRFYADASGQLQYSYGEDSFIDNLTRLKGMFSEGLIDPKLAKESGTTNLRTTYYFSDKVPTNKMLGFMTSDFTASTTSSSTNSGIAGDLQYDVVGILPPTTTTPASNGEFLHYTENSRTIKSDAWAITSHKNISIAERNKALEVLNYFFTEEGQKVQNYGTKELWEVGAEYTNPFDGTKGPLFNKWTLDMIATVKSDTSAFLRDWIGAQIPIGYQKEIGFELQTTNKNGMDTWDLYFKANDGKAVTISSYDDSVSPYYQLVPAVFPLKKTEISIVNDLSIVKDFEAHLNNLFLYFDSSSEVGYKSIAEIKTKYIAMGSVSLLRIYRDAYKRITAKKQ